MKLKLTFFLLYFFISSAVFSSETELFFEKIASRNGRSFGFATGITTCNNHFLWFSTRDGLYRYDGYNYKFFKKKSTDTITNILADVTYLYKDNYGTFWLRHFDQLGTFENEKVTKRYSNISDSIFLFNTKIIQDSEQNYWIGPTRYGLLKYDKNLQNAKQFQCAPLPFYNNFNDIVLSQSGEIVVVYPYGISLYNTQKQAFDTIAVNWNAILGSKSAIENMVIIPNYKSNYWIGTNNGLIHYNTVTRKHTAYCNSKKDIILTSNNIICLLKDKQQNLWIGTDNGLTIIYANGQMERIKASNKNGLYSNYIYNIYQDFSNNIWVATSEGLNKLKKNTFTQWSLQCVFNTDIQAVRDENNNFWYPENDNTLVCRNFLNGDTKKYSLSILGFNSKNKLNEVLIYNDILLDNDFQHIWLSIDNQLVGFNKKTLQTDKNFKIGAIISGKDSIPNKIFDIDTDKYGNLWLTCLNGVACYNKQTGKKLQFRSFNNIKGELYQVDLNYIKSTTKDNYGNIYIRTTDKIFQIDPSTTKMSTIFTFTETENSYMHGGNISTDAKGTIWFASLPYFYSYSPKNKLINEFVFKSDAEISYCNIVPDSLNIWIYTNNGLFRYCFAKNEYKSYFFDDGLPDNTINGLRITKNKQIWIATSRGLCNFNAIDETFTNYFTPFDNQSLIFKSIPKRLVMNDNELLLFTSNRILYLNTDSINQNTPKVAITNINLFGNELITDSLTFQKKYLKLKYNQNFLTFHFSALDYTVPEKNKYKYKLEGIDNEWQFTDASNRVANYTNLPTGTYRFVVKACNNDLIWNDEGTSIVVVITPPWYKTIWAYALYIIFSIVSIYLFVKYREKHLKEENKILEEKVKERTETISCQNERIMMQMEHIVEQKKDITDSIEYAKQIQTALLPPDKLFATYFSDYFVLYRPRNIVSGDFYWLAEKDNHIIITAADCTGHGVPGAFMSMLGISALTEIIGISKTLNAAEILNQLKTKIILLLRQTNDIMSSKDGMDIALCVYNKETNILQYAGAMNSIYIVNNEGFKDIRADRMPIGISDKDVSFKNNCIEVQKGDVIYLFSDGYVDQFHHKTYEKFKTKRFQELFRMHHSKTLTQQKEILNNQITEWMGESEQIDDIMVVGIRI